MFNKLFSGNGGDITPRASAQTGAAERNPFDLLTPSPSRKGSASVPSGARTPTLKSHPPLGQPPIVSSNLAGPNNPSYFGLASPGVEGDGQALSSAATTGAAPVTPGGLPTTAVTKDEPDFSFRTQPSQMARRRDNGLAPKGKLSVKLISARNLAAPSSASRPYVVVTFDQNEFVSREPIHHAGEEATGVGIPVDTPTDAEALLAQSSTAGQQKEKINVTNPPNPPNLTGMLSNVATSGIGKSLDAFRLAMPEEHTKAHSSTSSSGGSQNSNDSHSSSTQTDTANEEAVHSPNSYLSAYNPIWKHEALFDVMNEKSLIQVQIFDRSVEEEMFLGLTEIRPRLVNDHTVDQWFPLTARVDEHVTGEIRIRIRYEKFDVKKGLAVNDFDFLRMIGKGTFGRVFQVRKKDTKRIYAMKVLSKREIVAKKEVAHTIGERKILQRSSDSPFLLGLKFSFQSETDLYLVMDYKSGGELFHHLQKEGRFTEDRARFYTAEIVLAFEHLHKFDIVYRDLKPENILLDATGHIVLCDFGLSKPDLPSDALTNTFCGTTEYLAPEVLLDDHGYSKLVDFWSLGVLLFEMCCGWSPFYAEDTQQMYKLICFGKVKFPRGVIGEDGKQFVKGLLNRNPKHRLGATRDAAELKEHPFFKCIDWEHLATRQIAPPFKPYVDSDESVANFDPEFTEANLLEEAPVDVLFDDNDPSADWLDQASASVRGNAFMQKPGPVEIKQRTRPPISAAAPLTNSVQENFRGFTFSGEGESMIHFASAGINNQGQNSNGVERLRQNDEEEWEDTDVQMR